MFSFTEPFLEAVPQVIVLLCIGFLSGSAGLYDGVVDDCLPQNCGIVSLIPTQDPWFFGTFCLSVFSASFGMTRFLKVGPMTLVPRNSYGLSFFVAFLHFLSRCIDATIATSSRPTLCWFIRWLPRIFTLRVLAHMMQSTILDEEGAILFEVIYV